MLVLTRKIGEQIIIANDIRITIVSTANGRVKIGIDAPASVKVDRQEIHEKKKAETIVLDVDSTEPRTDFPQLHNRISGKLPVDPGTPSVSTNTPAPITVENRLRGVKPLPPRLK